MQNGSTCIPSTCSGSSTQECLVANGTGTQSRTCSLGIWSDYDTCTVTSCNNGYTQSADTCIQSILPINVTVYLSTPDSTINSDLTCNYDVSGNDVGVIVQWYKNNQYVTKGPTTLTRLNLAVGDSWYCLINVTDPYNKTYRSSNTVNIVTVATDVAAKASGGSGGGGGNIIVPDNTPKSSPLNIKPIPVPVSQNNNPEVVTNSPVDQVKMQCWNSQNRY